MEQRLHRLDHQEIRIEELIGQITDDNDTSLHEAVRLENVEMATVLLDAGADVNMRDNHGNTPLSLAMDLEFPSMVDLLLKYHPDLDIDVVREKFYNSLKNNSSTECEKIVRSLLQFGFIVKESDATTELHVWGSINKDLEHVAIDLVAHRRNHLSRIRHWYLSFSLHMQPFTSHQTRMFDILKNINDLFTEGTSNATTDHRNRDLFKILLSTRRVSLLMVNFVYRCKTNEDIPALLISTILSCYDSENPICDDFGRTGLHYAAQVGNFAVIVSFLCVDLDIIYVKDVEGKTALDYAFNKIEELTGNDDEHDENSIDQDHYDTQFDCKYTLRNVILGAILLLQHWYKMNQTDTSKHKEAVRKLCTKLRQEDKVKLYFSTYIDKCEKEIKTMENERFIELTYLEFIGMNDNQMAPYTKRKEVIEALQMNHDILKKFKIFGPILKHRFESATFRRGLLDVAENIIFDSMMCHQIPIEIARKILSNLSNNELYDILTRT